MIVDHLASPAVAGFSVSKIKGQGPTPAVGAMVMTVPRHVRPDRRVVNSAGIFATAPLAEVGLDRWRQVMAVDVESVVTINQPALPSLLDYQGCIVNVASLAGLGGDPKMTM